MTSRTFAVKNDNQDICDCLVKIAEKNGYTYGKNEFYSYLHFYSIDNSAYQPHNVVQYLDTDMYRQALSAVDNFAEIVRRLEESSTEKVHQQKGDEVVKNFYIKVETPEIADCLVRIAEKNGYDFGDDYHPDAYLYFYPSIKAAQFLDGIADSQRELFHETNDFAEIIRRLEKQPPSPKKVAFGEYEGEISVDGRTLKLTSHKEGFAIHPHMEFSFDELDEMCRQMADFGLPH